MTIVCTLLHIHSMHRLSGCSPFLGDDNQETYANIVAVDYHFDEEYFDSISDDAKLFVEELLKKNPRLIRFNISQSNKIVAFCNQEIVNIKFPYLL